VYVVDLKVGDRAFVSVVEDGAIEWALFLPNGQALRREAPAGPTARKTFRLRPRQWFVSHRADARGEDVGDVRDPARRAGDGG
jgi:hypothetical protein